MPVRKASSATQVNELLENKKEKVVLIKADEDVEYSAVMDAMDAAPAGRRSRTSA